MEQAIILAIVIIFGLMAGSFSGAMVWRLRARQLEQDKAAGEHVDKKEYTRLKKLLGASVAKDRSLCLHCHHQLQWYDLVPLISWTVLRGKCRYCHKPIGRMEPLIEVGTAMFFVVSYLAWSVPLESTLSVVEFVLWLVIGVGLIILFTYDLRWFLLPDKVVFPLIGMAAVFGILQLFQAEDRTALIISLVFGCVILSGLYYVLYVISRGAWIGFGDIKLGLILALVLADWQLAFLTLFLANVLGFIIVLPGLLARKLSRTSHVPFGPMLIAAFFVVGLFGHTILAWYFGVLGI